VRTLISWIRQAAFVLNVVGGAILVVMLVAVLIDILTRTVFGLTGGRLDLTFQGSFEIVRYGLLLSLSFAMPYALPRAQVVVDLFTDNLPEWMKERLAGVYTLFFGVFGFLMSYRMVESAHSAVASGETTQDLLIPMTYIYVLTAVGMFMLGLRGVSVAYAEFFLKEKEIQVTGDAS